MKFMGIVEKFFPNLECVCMWTAKLNIYVFTYTPQRKDAIYLYRCLLLRDPNLLSFLDNEFDSFSGILMNF